MVVHILVLSFGLLLLAAGPGGCDGQTDTGGTLGSVAQAAALATPYIDPANMLPFGPHSHWIQPWRSYLETLPASSYIKGSGINLNSDGHPDLIVRMLASHGIKHARIEIGWGHLDYDNETDTSHLAHYRAQLAACKRWGVRPLILLNANEGAPTPHRFFERTVGAAAPAGSRTIRLTDTTGLVVGRSGLSDVTTYRAAEILFTAMSGNTLTLSKPLPAAVSAGQTVKIAVLKYRPFSVPGSAHYNETLAGWNRYVATVSELAMDAMGTTGAADKGFDLEVWNELTFGSAFLDINNYYAPSLVTYDPNLTWEFRLIEDTAQGVAANPRLNASVELVNGFANTVPWPASSRQPARVSGISRHPYPQYKTFPQDDQDTPNLNALGQEDSYVPSYSVRFPEYFGTWIQTESMLRESSPMTNSVYGTNHGRNARIVNGAVAPVWGWITEVAMHPGENGVATAAAAHAFKAKVGLRLLTFYIGKGTKYVDLYSTSDGGDLGLALVQENFEAYARSNSTYPADDTAYTSPFLAAQGRMVARMSEGLDPTLDLAHTRSVQVTSISDTHNHIQVSGDGSAAHPHLYNRDLLVILPYQVNAARFAIQYYVMTRDVRNDLAPEEYRVVLSGMNGTSATVTAYDPIRDVTVPVQVNARGSNTLDLTLTADDQPYLLIVDESGPPLSPPPPPPLSGCPGELIVDNLAPRQNSPEVSFTGTWTTSVGRNPYGSSSLYSAGSGIDTYTWKPPVLTTGQTCAYQVFVRWTQHPDRSAMVPITVSGHTEGPTTRTFDERTGGGVWTLHGTYTFPAGAQPTVQVTDQNGQASADAVRFVPSGTPTASTSPCAGESIVDNLGPGQRSGSRRLHGQLDDLERGEPIRREFAGQRRQRTGNVRLDAARVLDGAGLHLPGVRAVDTAREPVGGGAHHRERSRRRGHHEDVRRADRWRCMDTARDLHVPGRVARDGTGDGSERAGVGGCGAVRSRAVIPGPSRSRAQPPVRAGAPFTRRRAAGRRR